jgi:hypothetical protein
MSMASCPTCGQPSAVAELERLQGELRQLHRTHPTLEMSEAAQNLTAQLHIAVHGATWARPETPEQVWRGLLAEVMAMRDSTGTGTERKD